MFGLTVTGNPPMKPTSQYTIIGKSYANTVTPSKVTGKEVWVTDVRLPNMLHGRVVHPKTLGSTLISVGELNKTRYPNAQVVVKGNLVGVVAPSEWEAIGASQQVAADTKWTEWKGLPGHTQLHAWLREKADWKTTPVSKSEKNRGDVAPALAAAAKTLSASYELPFMKHAPIGPTIAVADARPDGTVYIHTHNQNPQALRGQIAMMLGTSIDNVVVRIYAGAGHYGRSNGGNAGAEDEAVILSKAVGQAGARAMDAARRPAVVNPVAARNLRHPARDGTQAGRSRAIRRTTTCPRCRTTVWSARSSPGCRRRRHPRFALSRAPSVRP